MTRRPRVARDPSLPESQKKRSVYQSEVSTRLAEQVLGAQWELLRGFQAADRASGHKLLAGHGCAEHGEHIQGGLTTTLLRLVFLLYAEDQGLMPDDDAFVQNYSVTGLYTRLRADIGLYPDLMDECFGAWATLLGLFRMVHDGGDYEGCHLPTRHGELFSPDAYPFLEGRPFGVTRIMGERISPPHVPDSTVYRVLGALLMLDGERLSYSALGVEQIGSVYEVVMGFVVERAVGRAIGITSDTHRNGGVRADPIIDIDKLLRQKPGQRAKWLLAQASCKLTDRSAALLKNAQSPEDVVVALGRKLSARTPHMLPAGTLYLQPSEERRRSGSHYTPRELSKPIVQKTLEPVLAGLTAPGQHPTTDQILALKVCDPAMGSGAFLVEACRQLADALVTAWEVHGRRPDCQGREYELLTHARSLVAQHCLYGVDKNPFAVSLAKLSLWLVTLAKDHPFTFVDHALKCGDSLVGLTREQIGAFHWRPIVPASVLNGRSVHAPRDLHAAAYAASDLRAGLRALGDDREDDKRAMLQESEHTSYWARLTGDLVVAAFFAADKAKHRETQRQVCWAKVDGWRAQNGDGASAEARATAEALYQRGVRPFHWELEFPEVFDRDNPGFDAMVGNPPFVGVVQLAKATDPAYVPLLRDSYPGTGGNCDLAAYFFRRAFQLLRRGATAGFIATNTIAQGDTRDSGLGWICEHGGRIYHVTKRLRWPGMASVVITRIHFHKDAHVDAIMLDGRHVERISAFLCHMGGNFEPTRLADPERGIACKGVIPYSMGFVFEDDNPHCTPLAEMRNLLASQPKSEERLFRFLGGADFNRAPNLSPSRFIIDFGEMTEPEARRWPGLFAIVEAKVKPRRLALPDTPGNKPLRDLWWQYGSKAKTLYNAIRPLTRVLVCSQTSKYRLFAFTSATWVFDQKVIVFSREEPGFFAILQSRIHELWAIFFGGSMKDDPVYTPPSCFDTFPFPEGWRSDPALEVAGRAYHEYRARLMIDNDQGLTATYNRFHDPDERDPRILRLRELHTAMDRAVLAAYGWHDIATACEFLLDYIDAANRKASKRKPFRYRWPEFVHDEVLARLLELNRTRAAQETGTERLDFV